MPHALNRCAMHADSQQLSYAIKQLAGHAVQSGTQQLCHAIGQSMQVDSQQVCHTIMQSADVLSST